MMIKYFRNLIFLVLLLSSSSLFAQVTLAFQGGEPGNTWGYTSTGASAIVQAEASLSPNIVTGTKSIVVGGNTGGGNCWAGGTGNGPNTARTFTFNSVDISSSSGVARTLKFNYGTRFPTCNGTGWDSGENLVFTAYHNGVAQPPVTIVNGSNNAAYSIKTSQYTWNIPTCVNTFSFVISVTTNRADEDLFLDDVKLTAPSLTAGANANAGPDQSICPGGSAQLQATGGGTYSWTPATGLSCTNCPNPVASPAVTTQYIVTVTLPSGCFDKDTVIVDVSGPAKYLVTAVPDQICIGDTAKINLANSQIGINYSLFQIGNPVSLETKAGTGSPLLFEVPNLIVGSYQYYIQGVSSPTCNAMMNDTVTVTVNPVPAIYITSTANNNLCAGDTVKINLSNAESGMLYTLYQGAASTGITQTPSSAGPIVFEVPNMAPSAIPYTYYILAGNGPCAKFMDDTVAVTIKPSPTLYTLSNSTTICEGDTVLLQLSSSQMNAVYTLYKDNIITTVIRNGDNDSIGFLITGLTNGTYTYFIEAELNGCKRIMNDTVTITVAPAPALYITSTSNNVICQGDTVRIQLSNAEAGVVYTLFEGNTSTGITQTPAASGPLQFEVLNVTASVIPYQYYISATAGSCSKIMDDTVAVTVKPRPALFELSNDINICEGDTILLKLDGSELNAIYRLYKDGVLTTWTRNGDADSLGFHIINLTAGSYTFYAVSELNGCTRIMTDTVMVNVAPSPAKYITSTANNIICEGDTITLDLSNAQAGVTYTVFEGSSSTGIAQTPSASGAIQFELPNVVSSGTPYQYYISANIGSCSKIMDDTVAITVNPSPIIYDLSNTITICEGDTVLLQLNNSQMNAVYKLYENNIATSLVRNGDNDSLGFFITALASGSYTYYVESELNGCKKIMNDTITVTVAPTPLQYTTSTINATACEGDAVQIDLSNAQAGVTYTLFEGSSATAMSQTPAAPGPVSFSLTNVPASATPYQYYISASIGSCSKIMDDTVSITIHQKTNPTITGNYYQIVSNGKQDSTITATASNGGNLTWTIIPGGTGSAFDALSPVTGTSITVDFGTTGGTDTIIVTESGICAGSDTILVNVEAGNTPSLNGCIVINEIMINAADGNDGAPGGSPSDWIELYNTCCTPVDISCYVFGDGDWSVSIPAGTILPPFGYYTIGSNNCEGGTPSLNYNTCTGCIGSSGSLGIYTNGTEQAVLFRPDGAIEDAVIWGGGQALPATVNGGGACGGGVFNLPANGPAYESLGGDGGNNGCSKARSVDGGTTWVNRCGGGSFGATNGGAQQMTVNITNSNVPIDVCLGKQDSILTSVTTGVGILSWTINAGGTGTVLSGLTDGASVEVDFGNTPGTVIIYLTITNGSCQVKDSVVFNLVSSQAVAIITNDIIKCAGSNDTIVKGTRLPGVVYSWALNTGAVTTIVGSQTRDSVIIRYGNPVIQQTDTLILTASGPCASGNDTILITVMPAPKTYIVASTGNNTFCEGTDSIAIRVYGSQVGVNYILTDELDNQIETIVGTGNPIDFGVIHQDAGAYVYHVIADNGTCQITLMPVSIVIEPLPDSTLQASGMILCGDEDDGQIVIWNSERNTTYRAFTSNGVAGNAVTGNGNNIVITIPIDSLSMGVNRIQVKTSNGNCEGMLADTALITMYPPSVAAFTTDLTEAQLLYLPDATIRFNNNSTPGNYFWDFGDGEASTETNPSHTYKNPGHYDVILRVCNADSTCCDEERLISVEVTNEDTIDIPNVFTPNGDGVNDVFHIFRNGLTRYKIYVFSRWGEKIWENTSTGEDWDGVTRLGLKSPEGTYIYQIEAIRGNGATFTKTGTFLLIR